MAKNASLDTNSLLRWALQDIPEQAEKVDVLLRKYDNLHVADVAIIEMVSVLETLYKLPRKLVAEHIELVMSQSSINCNRALFAHALVPYRQYPSLSIVDCCLASYAELDQVEPLYTFDKSLAAKLPQVKLG